MCGAPAEVKQKRLGWLDRVRRAKGCCATGCERIDQGVILTESNILFLYVVIKIHRFYRNEAMMHVIMNNEVLL